MPEIWIGVAEHTGIDALRATTRDIPDYDVLMRQRLRLLEEYDLGVNEIQRIIAGMVPLEGAKEFLDWLRSRFQVIILSDTFYEFSQPLMRQLDFPALFLPPARNRERSHYRLQAATERPQAAKC